MKLIAVHEINSRDDKGNRIVIAPKTRFDTDDKTGQRLLDMRAAMRDEDAKPAAPLNEVAEPAPAVEEDAQPAGEDAPKAAPKRGRPRKAKAADDASDEVI